MSIMMEDGWMMDGRDFNNKKICIICSSMKLIVNFDIPKH